ncbi:ribonuclease H-like domain-containing protein [Tanacetum coccineum]
MVNCNPTRTPVDTESKLGPDADPVLDPTLYRSLASGLQYLTFTRPDIYYAVQQICFFMHDPQEPYLAAFKRVLRYVRGGLHLVIVISGPNILRFIHFVRDMVARGQVHVLHVPSHYQYDDIFTKGLPSALFEEFRTTLSIRPYPAQTVGAYYSIYLY